LNRGRRILRVAKNLLADRRDPPLDLLERETDPDKFLWRMLPHAARTFSLAIAVLPDRLARTIGVAYLCCRILDTVEDLARDVGERDRLFEAATALARDGTPLPPLREVAIQDARDRAHLVLVRRSALVAQLLASLDPAARARIAGLVARMAAGMKRAARVRAAAGGVVSGEEREHYCRAVLAEPLLFAEGELRCARGLPPEPPADRRAAGLQVGELVQLANVCRDVEKDLARGVAYDDALAGFVGRASEAPAALVAAVRRRVLERVGALSGAVVPFFTGLPFGGVSGSRGASLVLLITTARFFQKVNATLEPPPLARAALPAGFGAAAACAAGALSRGSARRSVERAASGLQSAPR
jgi:phytoene/squalene synthetase